MARIELQGWPTGQWDDGRNAEALAPAVSLLQRAVAIETDNRTAQHRLGLIAMVRQDFDTAVDHLEIAHELDPHHRGLVKTLGYSYAWQGNLDQAAALLAHIPESHREMREYEKWWGYQGRPDLAAYAEEMAMVVE
jgi:Flp pilus assembly protein TadD